MVEYGITDTGYRAKPYEAIERNVRLRILSVAGAAFDLSPTVPMGAMHAGLCAELAVLWDHSKQAYDGTDRIAAQGQQVVNQGKLVGAYLKDARKGSVLAVLTHKWASGTHFDPGSILVARRGDPSNTWTNRDPIDITEMEVVGGEIQSTSVGAYFESVQASALAVAPANSLTQIIGTITGLQYVTNLQDATPGRDAETPDELRIRLEVEQEGSAVTTIGALRADLNALPIVLKALVYSNRTDQYVRGIRPRALRCIVWDGSPAQTPDATIANTIFRHLDGGTDTEGRIVVQIADDDGQLIPVRFDRCQITGAYVSLTAYGAVTFEAIVQKILELAQPQPKEPLKVSAISAAVLAAGCYDVANIRIGPDPAPTSSANMPPISDGIVLLDSIRMSIMVLP